MATDSLYPPAPAGVPAELTRLPSAYRLRVLAMIGGLFLFLLLYCVFIAVAGLLAYWLLIVPLPHISGRGIVLFLVFKFGGAFAMLLLWLFLFKGLFKGQRVERSGYVVLQEQDYPAVFAFIRKVYQDTGSRRPRRVYVSPEVNAALVYNTSLLNLVLPPRKDLLIGLGLVNVVNLSEFKAVLAHEFGHFAQRSVGLGSYLYVANRVLSDIIYSRDGLDRFVDQWSQQDIRISFPAWGLKGVLWVVRGILAGTYQGINLLHLSLSRQMEYNADNVAVRVSGSDALINGLARLAFAQDCLADAAQALNAAADHGLFSDDLFYHQTQAAARLRRLRKDDRAGLPPELSRNPTEKVQVFQPVADGIPDKYRSHPTDYMREQNAKRIYLYTPQDERSPWLLFGDPAGLKAEVTGHFYRHGLGRREDYTPQPAAAVQQFIDAEHAESTYDPRYQGLYDDRLIDPGDLQRLPAQPWTSEQLAGWLAAWPPENLQEQLQRRRLRLGEYDLLQGLQSGQLKLKGKTFAFRDRQYESQDVSWLLTQVGKELDADQQAFVEQDRQAFLAHWSLARHFDGANGGAPGRENELLERYRFHLACQRLLQDLLARQGRLQAILGVLSSNPQLSEQDFREICKALEEIHETLTATLNASRSLRTPSLTNVPAGSVLHSLIVDRGDTALPRLSENTITGEWLGKLMTRLQGVQGRLQRVHFKSLGSLLAFQEKLADQWKAESPINRPASTASETHSS